MRTLAQRVLWIPTVVWLVACGARANEPVAADPTAVSTTDGGEEPSLGSSDHDSQAAISSDSAASDGIPRSIALLQGSEDGARAFLARFVAPDANPAALTSALRPTKSDYEAMFVAGAAARVEAAQAKEWRSHGLVIKPKAGQTAIKVWSATGTELANGTGGAKDFPAEYKTIASHLTPSLLYFRFQFSEPGKDDGSAYDGLAFVSDHWVIAPHPWRALAGKGRGGDDAKAGEGHAKPKPKPKPKPKDNGSGKKH